MRPRGGLCGHRNQSSAVCSEDPHRHAVSDVYKRQGAEIPKNGKVILYTAEPDEEDYVEAVSYTHLDVYKRQVLGQGRPADGEKLVLYAPKMVVWHFICLFCIDNVRSGTVDAVSYTHLAAGCGMKVEDVNRLCNQLKQMQKLMKQLGGKKGKKMLSRMGNMGGFDMGGMGGFPQM